MLILLFSIVRNVISVSSVKSQVRSLEIHSLRMFSTLSAGSRIGEKRDRRPQTDLGSHRAPDLEILILPEPRELLPPPLHPPPPLRHHGGPGHLLPRPPFQPLLVLELGRYDFGLFWNFNTCKQFDMGSPSGGKFTNKRQKMKLEKVNN